MAYQVCLNDDPSLTLTYLTSRSNLLPNALKFEIFWTETIFTQNSTLKCNRPSCPWAEVLSHIVAYVEKDKIWARVNFVTIFGELYQIKLWGISNDFIQFTYLRSASGVDSDVIKMAVTALLIRIFIVYVFKYVSLTKSFIVYCSCRSRLLKDYFYTVLYMPEGVHIWHSYWLLSVDYNKGLRSDHRCDLGIEDQSQKYLESIWLMARNTNSSFMFWLRVFIFCTMVACGV